MLDAAAQNLINFQELLHAERHRVQMLTLQPDDSLPEQMHLYACKMLVVMEGCASVLCGDKTRVLLEGESHSIAACTAHQIVNSGKIPLRVLDIRRGACVADDDRAA